MTNDYLDQLERERVAEISRADELRKFWCEQFPTAKWIPPEHRFLWWVRKYDQRILQYAVTTAAMTLNHKLHPERLGKYVSAVARNVALENERRQKSAERAA